MMNVEIPPSGNSLLNAYLVRAFNNIKNAIDSLKTVLVNNTIKNPGLGRFYLVATPTEQFTNKGLYYYNGQEFVQLAEGTTSGIELGILHTQAFYGDLGQEAYLHTQNTNNPHNVTATQIGLDKVDNTADADKPVSNATLSELNKYVLKTIAVNSKPLSNNITLTTADVAPTANRRYLTFAEYTRTTMPADATHDGYLKATDWVVFNAKEDSANKDIFNGYTGLTALKINFKNVLNTFTSYFTNSNTASRTYTFQDKNQTIAGLDDILPTTLTGLSKSAGTLSVTDTILQAFNKIAGLIDNDAWVSYTPSLSGITLGNGTLTGSYKKIGRTVFYRVSLTFGSTTSITGAVYIGTPTTIVGSAAQPLAEVFLLDANVGYYSGRQFGNGAVLYMSNPVIAITATNPFTWTTSDAIIIKGFYESST